MTPQDMFRKMLAAMEPKTGRTFEQWVEVARASGIATHKALAEHLKAAHGLNHNEAQWVAWEVVDPGRMAQYEKPKDMVDDLYSGKKAHLRPIYDRLLAEGLALGADVTHNVCRTYTSLAVGTQFAILNPRTNGGVDVELVLPAGAEAGEPFKSSNPKFNRRLRVTSVDGVDGHVVAAMRAAADTVRR